MVMYSLTDIFEYVWSVEVGRSDSKPAEDLILELKQIEKETNKLAEDF